MGYAEDGIAAHWHLQKPEPRLFPMRISSVFTWFKQILEELKDLDDPRELMETVSYRSVSG